MPDKSPPEVTASYRHPPPPPLASLASLPLSSCEESVRHYVNQTPPPRTPPTALLPNHHTDIFDMQPFTAAPMISSSAASSSSTASASSPGDVSAEPLANDIIISYIGMGREPWLVYHITEPFTAAPMISSSAASSSSTASASSPGDVSAEPLSAQAQAALLAREPWFHGPISRTTAEKLVVEDGEFLVRESAACPGQFVLTGARKGSHKHLLLVDPNGVVRTKDRVFESVPHLIKYHCSNELPIVSADSALLLRKPVLRDAT
ncbi:hypothetical protein B5X24_HaOG215951 [Helicoverpa armigera]|nr:hypothetical protein B5X24_HaOG215951 [Helicoverpa armigera]